MKALVYGKLGNIPHADVEDIVQEAMIRVHKHYDEHREASIKTYAYITVETQIAEYLKNKKEFNMVLSLDEPIGQDEDGNEVLLGDTIKSDENVEADYETKEQVAKLLDLLSEDDRLMVELYYFQGYTMEELATIYEMPNKCCTYVKLQAILEKLKISVKKT